MLYFYWILCQLFTWWEIQQILNLSRNLLTLNKVSEKSLRKCLLISTIRAYRGFQWSVGRRLAAQGGWSCPAASRGRLWWTQSNCIACRAPQGMAKASWCCSCRRLWQWGSWRWADLDSECCRCSAASFAPAEDRTQCISGWASFSCPQFHIRKL